MEIELRPCYTKLNAVACVAFASTLVAAPAYAKQLHRTYIGFGVGSDSCAKALSSAQYSESLIWAMGYFSGLNRALLNKVGRLTDGEGIFAEVKLVCEAEPSMQFQDTIDRVYDRMGRQSR